MAADGITATVKGIPELREALLGLPAKLRRRALMNALRAAGRVVQKRAREVAPRLKHPVKGRTPGLLVKKISVRTSKLARKAGDAGVFINVRPAAKGQRGRNSPTDPFYWRWIEFGWNPAGRHTGGLRGNAGKRYRRRLNASQSAKIRTGWRFLEAGGKVLDAALAKFIATIGPQIERLNGGRNVDL
jgi:hypothetical protein